MGTEYNAFTNSFSHDGGATFQITTDQDTGAKTAVTASSTSTEFQAATGLKSLETSRPPHGAPQVPLSWAVRSNRPTPSIPTACA